MLLQLNRADPPTRIRSDPLGLAVKGQKHFTLDMGTGALLDQTKYWYWSKFNLRNQKATQPVNFTVSNAKLMLQFLGNNKTHASIASMCAFRSMLQCLNTNMPKLQVCSYPNRRRKKMPLSSFFFFFILTILCTI